MLVKPTRQWSGIMPKLSQFRARKSNKKSGPILLKSNHGIPTKFLSFCLSSSISVLLPRHFDFQTLLDTVLCNHYVPIWKLNHLRKIGEMTIGGIRKTMLHEQTPINDVMMQRYWLECSNQWDTRTPGELGRLARFSCKNFPASTLGLTARFSLNAVYYTALTKWYD